MNEERVVFNIIHNSWCQCHLNRELISDTPDNSACLDINTALPVCFPSVNTKCLSVVVPLVIAEQADAQPVLPGIAERPGIIHASKVAEGP